MILQALYEYYQRKTANDANALAADGFEYKEIPFIVVIDAEGKFVDLSDTREPNEKKQLRAKSFLVPLGAKKPSAVKADLLWDTSEYALGIEHARGNACQCHETPSSLLRSNKHHVWHKSTKYRNCRSRQILLSS